MPGGEILRAPPLPKPFAPPPLSVVLRFRLRFISARQSAFASVPRHAAMANCLFLTSF
jgi:hypothetical protein